MENFHNDYPYLKLNEEREEIRLLQLTHKSLVTCGPVQGKVIHAFVDEEPEYDALSYLWGDPTCQVSIELDGREFQVTRNLERALRSLSGEDTALTLWVDAICINQSDVHERSEQVQRMWRIYAGAHHVRSWLDIVPEDTSIFQRIHHLKSMKDFDGNIKSWEPILQITDHPYWKRVWIQQELSYANEITIHLPGVNIPHSELIKLFRIIQEYSEMPNKNQAIFGNESFNWSQFPIPETFFCKSNEKDGGNSPDWHFCNARRCFPNILQALLKQRNLQTSDDRDGLYALLSLVHNPNDQVRIDYSLSVSEVYCLVAAHMLREHRSLAFLNLAGCDLRSDFPTWLPFYRNRFPIAQESPLDSFQDYQDFLNTMPDEESTRPYISKSGEALDAHGMLISSIQHEVILDDFRTNRITSLLETLVFYFCKAAVMTPSKNLHENWLDGIHTFLRTVDYKRDRTKIKFRAWHQAIEAILVGALKRAIQGDFESWMASITKEEEELIDYPLRRLSLYLSRRCLVLLDGSSIGTAPREAMVGDEVWMLFRSPLPMVLRPKEGYYALIGPAFIDHDLQERLDAGMKAHRDGDKKCAGLEICNIDVK